MTTVTIPTALSIKLRFPEFASIDDGVIEFAIEEARLKVTDAWDSTGSIALAYLTAHYVAATIAASASGGSGDEGDIASENIGRLSITYAKPAQTAVHDDTSTSSYGLRFENYLQRNYGGPRVV
jgi:nicotinamide mononucleotide (NMN) deamidase PncC